MVAAVPSHFDDHCRASLAKGSCFSSLLVDIEKGTTMTFKHADLMPQRVAHWAGERPSGPALRHVDGSVLTWADAHQDSLRWSSALERLGVVHGEPVVTVFVNTFEAFHSWMGCAWLGAIDSPINTNYKGDWLRHVIDNTGARIVLAQDRFVGALFEIADQLSHVEKVVVFGSSAEIPDGLPFEVLTSDEFLADVEVKERIEPVPWDVSSLIYTSGTTGRSKAVKVPWGHYRSTLESGFIPVDRLDDIRIYSPFPVFHITGKGGFYFAARSGQPSVIREAFSITDYWDDIRNFDANATVLLGPLAHMLMQQPERPNDRDNPLRSVPLVPVIPNVDDFARRFDVDIHTCYNMTEINCPIIQQNPITNSNHDSCGQVRPGVEVRVVDEFDQTVPPDTTGELIMRTEPWEINTGYWNMADKTNEAWRNGWFHTGDAFTYDGDGNFYFVDRAKDYIRRRGENISSFEVEALVNEYPAVAECGACAVPAEEGEDEVKIAVVVAEGAEFDPAELIAFLAPRMPRFAIPRFIEVWDELPKTEATSRIQKAKIRDAGVTDVTWDRVTAGVKIPR
jgi:crotonobetaine/carnitine-CoA ligase